MSLPSMKAKSSRAPRALECTILDWQRGQRWSERDSRTATYVTAHHVGTQRAGAEKLGVGTLPIPFPRARLAGERTLAPQRMGSNPPNSVSAITRRDGDG